MKILKGVPFYCYHLDYDNLSFIERLVIKPKYEQPGFNQRMFNEDFPRVFHSARRQVNNMFNIESNDEGLIQKLLGNVHTRNRQHSVDETIRELIEEIAQSLVWFGKTHYFVHNICEQDKVFIRSLNPNGLFRFFSTFFQFVPKRLTFDINTDRESEMLPRELRVLDKTKVMYFEMPRSLRIMLSKQNRTLAVIDKHQFDSTKFIVRATHENPYPKYHFDFHIWENIQEQALYRATRKTGWNPRNYNSNKLSDFFLCYQLIKFRRNQFVLRDYILLQLSKELTKVGREQNLDFYITISPGSDLPQIHKLDELESKLSREEISFTEVLDYCHER
ncbi:hypothetical protein [Proteus mirabilis]|uniref:hypothetical protein n=2 Tax=Proteus mirabilis TaxID=584 RepID=UPI0018C80759|nr:hypothetical protein [Proteus mirabilis]MBG5979415.1 hypothetical protein [Proteus mirabilis]MBI6282290.1 hypothetical protein [Proteus mirabilis]MCW4519353.1 hypothetical protein [Proteus mirabilis]MDF7223886.1 hypothetical protein [Proteus mirabilis]MDF7262901.1 hypothetical protein [Proteus mirabilis]